jgi:hypothetical protein
METQDINTSFKDQGGQVLLAVLVAITISITLGVSLATRTTRLAHDVSDLDTSSMLFAAAEGGAERFLYVSGCYLESLSDTSDLTRYEDNCGNLGMSTAPGDMGCGVDYSTYIRARAVVSVESFNYNSPEEDYYRFHVDTTDVKEVALSEGDESARTFYDGLFVEVCWDNDQTAVYYTAYDTEGRVERGGFFPSVFSDPASHMAGLGSVVPATSDKAPFTWCGVVPLAYDDWDEPYGLRIKALYEGANFGVYPAPSAVLPSQGYKIVSRGELTDTSGSGSSRVVTVYRSLPYIPDVFDYSIFTNGAF